MANDEDKGKFPRFEGLRNSGLVKLNIEQKVEPIFSNIKKEQCTILS
jgi:hypothetical protein